MSNYKYKYYPKRPVKSFQDLEVYQKTLGLGVEIVKKVRNTSKESKHTLEVQSKITDKLVKTVLSIPKLIASAHSVRFGDSERAIADLEKAMLNCNLAVYYLELFRDLVNPVPAEVGIDHEYFEEQIKEYLRVRGKIMRLQRSWLRFIPLEKPRRKT